MELTFQVAIRMVSKLSRATVAAPGRSTPERETPELAPPWLAWKAVTPDSDSPENLDVSPRPTRRAILLGALGVLAAGAMVAVAGFLAGGGTPTGTIAQAVGVDTQHGQLGTYALHDEKPMRAIGKGVVGVTPTGPATTSPTPTPTPTP